MRGRGRNRRFWRNPNREESSKKSERRGGDSWEEDGWNLPIDPRCGRIEAPTRGQFDLSFFYEGDERAGTGWGFGLVVSGRMTLPRPKMGP